MGLGLPVKSVGVMTLEQNKVYLNTNVINMVCIYKLRAQMVDESKGIEPNALQAKEKTHSSVLACIFSIFTIQPNY